MTDATEQQAGKGYQKVDPWVDIVTLEQEILALWKRTDAFAKRRELSRGKPPWSFLDGPITANNPMGVHHAWGRTLKDAFQRYWAMNGRELRYQNGFDCQGLWVEVEVEKAHGFNTKRDIAEYGIDRFVNACKERVLTYAARQTEQSVRLGYWMDWDTADTLLALRDGLREGASEITVTSTSGETMTAAPEAIIAQLGSPDWGGSYFTFATENNYTIWSFLKKCHDEGFIYLGTDVMPWCCRCGTGLSQMEVTEGRKITSHTSVFVRFPLRNREKEALLVWTTTPWTLTSNVAAAVNPEMTYLKVRHGEWTYYVGKGNFENARVQNLEASGKRETHTLHTVANILKGSGETEVLGELPGSELVGLTYHGPFDHLEAQNRPGGLDPYTLDTEGKPTGVECHRVLPWDEVSDAEGTGIVHIAPGCGAEDKRLGGEHGIVAIAPLDESGFYLEGFGELTGQHVLEVADTIVADLKARGRLVAKESYPHVYPHCWRCKQELVFRLVDEWFIRMDWRDRIQKVVPEIQWIPADGEAREMDWLRNMGDWMISKKRFWGLALPIWQCTSRSCDWFDVIGSREELQARATAGWEAFDGHTPHRPWVDAVTLECQACGGEAHRVEDVGNPWLDAGIVPYSTIHFNTDPEYFEKWFPADLVLECFPGQFRNWFYALLSMSAMMTGQAPFKTLLGHALVRDETGKEMHKTSGNAIWFDDAAEKAGADVMRWLYCRQDPVVNLNFGWGPLRDVRGRFFNTLFNTWAFFVNYARLAEFVPNQDPVPLAKRDDFDRWIISELNTTIDTCRAAVEAYDTRKACGALETFLDDNLSNWYIRHTRRRFYRGDGDDARAAFQTLYECLEGFIRLAAPFIPFSTEAIYQSVVRAVDADAPESVHHLDYPVSDASCVDHDLSGHMAAIQTFTKLALSAREAKGFKVRQPLAKLTVGPSNDTQKAAAERFTAMLEEDLNVKSVEVLDVGAESALDYAVKPNFKTLGRRLGKLMKPAAKAIAAQSDRLLAAIRDDEASIPLDVEGETHMLSKDDLLLSVSAPDDQAIAEERGAWVSLDTHLTEALLIEGAMRDTLRAFQVMRKDIGLEIEDRIQIAWNSDHPELLAVFDRFTDLMAEELLATSLSRDETLSADAMLTAKAAKKLIKKGETDALQAAAASAIELKVDGGRKAVVQIQKA